MFGAVAQRFGVFFNPRVDFVQGIEGGAHGVVPFRAADLVLQFGQFVRMKEDTLAKAVQLGVGQAAQAFAVEMAEHFANEALPFQAACVGVQTHQQTGVIQVFRLHGVLEFLPLDLVCNRA